MNYRIVTRDAFQAAGMKRVFSNNAKDAGISGIPEFWEEMNGNGTSDRLLQLNSGNIKGLLGICSNFNEKENTTDYWIAVECSAEDLPAEWPAIHFPAAKWVVFEVEGPVPSAITETWKQIYSEWFPSNGYKPAEAASFEAYIDPNPYRSNSYNEIWVPIK
ncbi:GyrI-like domain-containing protein [Pseudobacillus wudalianchiensis]|uniref:Transcriptional regulator n=1 Tax=Pseudobacillus wudalianchiensis TaxID=1743143 RepID=A0A1B9B9W2_9BACI|nr:transcriptional regulator [Bacillus wudalianchiensis]